MFYLPSKPNTPARRLVSRAGRSEDSGVSPANPFVTLGAPRVYFPLFAPCVGCQSNHTQGDHPYPQGHRE